MEQDPLSAVPVTRGADNPPPPEGRPEKRASHSAEPAENATEHSDWDVLGSTRSFTSNQDPHARTPLQVDVSQFSGFGGPGSLLGDFKIIRKLGQGAMATVYKAYEMSFGRKVALKVLHKHIADNPKLLERFYREARVMGQLDHPHIVQGYSVGEHAGLHFFAMEYVSGQSLQKWLNRLGRLTVPDALLIVLECARALDYAHNQDVIHRDIKPDNILITREGTVKVADLGMVKQLDEEMGLTQTGHAVGTPWYMPLEQARNSKDADRRCDIYALGCMLYCLLTGKPPFTGATLVEVIQAKELGTFPPARQSNSAIPERLDLIICKMTAKQPRYRYSSCAEVVRDIEALGLAGEELTWFAEPGATTVVPAYKGPGPSTITPDSATPSPGRTPTTDDLWYLRYKGSDGRMVVRKANTAQVLRMLETEQLSPQAKASREENGSYRAIATYKDFEQVALALATRRGVDRQTERYRQAYKKIEQQDRQRDQTEKPRAKADPVLGEMLRYALPIAGVVVGGVFLLWLISALIRAFS